VWAEKTRFVPSRFPSLRETQNPVTAGDEKSKTMQIERDGNTAQVRESGRKTGGWISSLRGIMHSTGKEKEPGTILQLVLAWRFAGTIPEELPVRF